MVLTFVNVGFTEKPMISVPVVDTVDTWILVPEALKVSVGCEDVEYTEFAEFAITHCPAVIALEVTNLLPAASSKEFPVTCKYPEAVRFVDDTEANELCPEIFNEAPWRYPLAVTLVPDPFVKNKLGKRP